MILPLWEFIYIKKKVWKNAHRIIHIEKQISENDPKTTIMLTKAEKCVGFNQLWQL